MRFDSYHPTINFIYFTTVIATTIYFNQPVFVAIAFVSSFIYSVKLNGIRALIFNIVLLFAMAAFVYYYTSFNHFGVTTLRKNWIDNNMTMESLVYSIVLALIIGTVILWFSCIHAIFYSDKVIYLFGRILPKASLYLSIILRIVPRVKERWRKISVAQQCIGKGPSQGGIFQRIINTFHVVSILFTWTLDEFMQTTESMKSRGYSLKGRTSFSIYRFDNRDRSFVMAIFWCVSILLVGVLLNQTHIIFDPQIIINKVTVLSYVFYTAYACLCLMPMGLQIIGEIRFKRLCKLGVN